MKKLKNILQSNKLYYLILIISVIYLIIYINTFELKEINDSEFYFTINNIIINDNKMTLELKGKYNMIGTYYYNSDDINNYKLNDLVYVKGNVSIPSNNTIPNIFNYNKYLKSKSIYYKINIESLHLIKSNNNILYKIKSYVYKRLKIINNDYMYAFIVGNTSYINDEVYNNYKINGILHLFAISGFHISIFVLILNKLLPKNNKYIRLIILPIILFILCFISSNSPSILRASIFCIFVEFNKVFKLNISKINILIIDFFVLIIINPFYIYNIGFLLSFIVSFFIIILNSNSTFKVSICAFFSGLPIIINSYFSINMIGFINNLFFIPLVGIIYPLSLFIFVFPYCIKILNFLTNIMEIVSYVSSKILNITIYFPKMSIYILIIYYFIYFLIIKYKKKYLILVLIFIMIFLNIKVNNNDYIYYLDVNQGDCILITIDGNSVLIDTGGNYSDYDFVNNNLLPFFRSINLFKINTLIITHGDYDHMGNAINLIENYKVDNVVFNCGEFNDLELELIEKLKGKNINYYSCIEKINLGKYKLEFLNSNLYDNENDNSSVIYLKYNNLKFLFMGDAGIEREKDIINKYNLTDIDFLKVGHHGSDTSTSEELIKEIKPKYSIISVGKNNRYGHPKQSILETLKKSNSKIYRTDEDGSIEIRITSDGYSIETCEP